MLSEFLEGGFCLVANSNVLKGLATKHLVERQLQMKIGKSVMSYPHQYSGLKKLSESSSEVWLYIIYEFINIFVRI